MNSSLLGGWKRKKQDKILAFSFFNHSIINLYNDSNIDIIRFDIKEFAFLNGYKDYKRVISSDFTSILSNSVSKIKSDSLWAVDVPLDILYSNDTISIEKVINYYQITRADFLVFNLEDISNTLIERLHTLNIPVILNIEKTKEDPTLFEIITNRIKEVQEVGVYMVFLNDFSNSFVSNLRENTTLPVISNNKNKKSDGFYAYLPTILGLIDDEGKYLNLNEVVKDAINDCTMNIRQDN